MISFDVNEVFPLWGPGRSVNLSLVLLKVVMWDVTTATERTVAPSNYPAINLQSIWSPRVGAGLVPRTDILTRQARPSEGQEG